MIGQAGGLISGEKEDMDQPLLLSAILTIPAQPGGPVERKAVPPLGGRWRSLLGWKAKGHGLSVLAPGLHEPLGGLCVQAAEFVHAQIYSCIYSANY